MMDEQLVEDQVVHGSHVDVQTEEITHANEKIVVQCEEYRKEDGDGREEPKRDKGGECIEVEGSVHPVDVDVVDQGSMDIVDDGVQKRSNEQALKLLLKMLLRTMKSGLLTLFSNMLVTVLMNMLLTMLKNMLTILMSCRLIMLKG